MESAVRLGYGPLPSAPLLLSSGATGAAAGRATGFHFRLSHESLRLPHFSARHQVSRSFGQVNCMLDRLSVPSKNDKSDNKILRGVTGISLVLSCVLGFCNLGIIKVNPKVYTAHASQSVSPSSKYPDPGHGMRAVESLNDMILVKPSEKTLPPRPKRPDENYFKELKLRAVGLSKSGKTAEAVNMLKKEYEAAAKNGESSDEHSLEMALVELLIFQGKYQEALERLDHQLNIHISPEPNDKKIEELLSGQTLLSRPKFLLYKAIILTKLQNKEAEKWWKAFSEIVT